MAAQKVDGLLCRGGKLPDGTDMRSWYYLGEKYHASFLDFTIVEPGVKVPLTFLCFALTPGL